MLSITFGLLSVCTRQELVCQNQEILVKQKLGACSSFLLYLTADMKEYKKGNTILNIPLLVILIQLLLQNFSYSSLAMKQFISE